MFFEDKQPLKKSKVEQTEEETKIDFTTQFPEELSLHILAFLDLKDLVKSSQANRLWYQLSHDETLWKIKCDEAGINRPENKDVNYKKKYQLWKIRLTLLDNVYIRIQKKYSSEEARSILNKVAYLIDVYFLKAYYLTQNKVVINKDLINCALFLALENTPELVNHFPKKDLYIDNKIDYNAIENAIINHTDFNKDNPISTVYDDLTESFNFLEDQKRKVVIQWSGTLLNRYIQLHRCLDSIERKVTVLSCHIVSCILLTPEIQRGEAFYEENNFIKVWNRFADKIKLNTNTEMEKERAIIFLLGGLQLILSVTKKRSSNYSDHHKTQLWTSVSQMLTKFQLSEEKLTEYHLEFQKTLNKNDYGIFAGSSKEYIFDTVFEIGQSAFKVILANRPKNAEQPINQQGPTQNFSP